jgi:methylglutaconyl-CoA hydratase
MLTGRQVHAGEAREIGLVNRVVAAGELENETQKLVDAVLQNAPGALASTKQLLEQLWSSSVKEDLDRALSHHMEARESAEAKEGIAAFLEKRAPHWS